MSFSCDPRRKKAIGWSRRGGQRSCAPRPRSHEVIRLPMTPSRWPANLLTVCCYELSPTSPLHRTCIVGRPASPCRPVPRIQPTGGASSSAPTNVAAALLAAFLVSPTFVLPSSVERGPGSIAIYSQLGSLGSESIGESCANLVLQPRKAAADGALICLRTVSSLIKHLHRAPYLVISIWPALWQ